MPSVQITSLSRDKWTYLRNILKIQRLLWKEIEDILCGCLVCSVNNLTRLDKSTIYLNWISLMTLARFVDSEKKKGFFSDLCVSNLANLRTFEFILEAKYWSVILYDFQEQYQKANSFNLISIFLLNRHQLDDYDCTLMIQLCVAHAHRWSGFQLTVPLCELYVMIWGLLC